MMYQVDEAALYKPPESGYIEMTYIKMAQEKKL
jgi:hypothetical protein